MSSFWIGWKGYQNNKELQKDLISYLKPVAELHNKSYFGKWKDKTTLEVFDNEWIDGKILIPLWFFNKDQEIFKPKNFNRLNEELFAGNLQKSEIIDDINYLVCRKVRLNGVQFKMNTDIGQSVTSKQYFCKVSFVFFDFGDETTDLGLIKTNLVEAEPFYELILLDGKKTLRQLKLTVNGFTYRYRNMDHLLELLEFIKYYHVNDLDIDAFGCRSNMEKYLMENDPGKDNYKIKQEAFQHITALFRKYALQTAAEEIRNLPH